MQLDVLVDMPQEMRAQLPGLLMLSSSLLENSAGELNDKQMKLVRIIRDAANGLLQLINNPRDLSRGAAGMRELVIDELSQRLQRTFAAVAAAKQLAFSVSIEADLPSLLASDSDEVEQIVHHLLSNAFKFTRSGSVMVYIGRPSDDLEIPAALSDLPMLALTVVDTGVGIAQDTRDRIFMAADGADAGNSEPFVGTGQRPARSQRMARRLGGDVVLQSEPGLGTRLTLLLPDKPPHQTPRLARLDHAAGDGTPGQDSPRFLQAPIQQKRDSRPAGQVTILVIEKDPTLVHSLLEMIQRRGYRALAAMDEKTGLQLAREHRPSVILLDLRVRGINGWNVLDQLKADDATRSIPIHFLAVNDGSRNNLQRDVFTFLPNPVRRESIAAVLDQLLRFDEGKQRRLLVVDGDADSRKQVRLALQSKHVGIDEAESSDDALQKIASSSYDGIVLDLGLPDLAGLALLQQLATAPSTAPPVAVYAARDLRPAEKLALRRYAEATVSIGAVSTEQLLEEVHGFVHNICKPAATAVNRVWTQSLAGRRVLLVDEDMRNLFTLSKALRGWGMQVSTAPDGGKALSMLDSAAAPEVVLMGITLPGIGGCATMRAIRANPRFTSLPIIAVAAKAIAGDRAACLHEGANDYLSKPIDIDKLGAMIEVWLAPQT